MAGSGNNYTLAAIATTASHSLPSGKTGWSLQHRHPDGRHWLEIGRFPTKELAKETAKAFVAAYYGQQEDFRVRRAKGPQD
jgi:hypothetical protein